MTSTRTNGKASGRPAASVQPVVTSLNGSRGSAHGNTTKNSSASTAATSANASTTLTGSGPGRCRQIHPYTHAPFVSAFGQLRRLSAGIGRVLRILLGEHAMHDQPLLRGEPRVAGRKCDQRHLALR